MRVVPADFFMLMTAPERLYLNLICGVTKLFVHPEDNKFCSPAYMRVSQGLYNDLRANARRITHRYPDDHLLRYRIVTVTLVHFFVSHISHLAVRATSLKAQLF
jgi:hypothetical protein